MGYQESFRPIEHIAESVGIKRAIEDYRDHPDIPEYCHYFCTSREKATGKLYACIGGQRCRVHIVACKDLDYCIPYGDKYEDYYEDLDDALVVRAAGDRPDLVERAYRSVAADFEEEVERTRERKRALRDKANALWPDVARLFMTVGPMPLSMVEAQPAFEGHRMYSVLVDLVEQGLVTTDGDFLRDNLRLTDKALRQLGNEELPPPLDIEGRLIQLLEACGPLGTGLLSRAVGRSASSVRAILRKLMEEGRVIPEGRGCSRRYRLVEMATPNS